MTDDRRARSSTSAEQKIYSVDVRKKEYTVMTFAQMREQMEKLKADMAKQQQSMNPEAQEGHGTRSRQADGVRRGREADRPAESHRRTGRAGSSW